MTFDLSGVGVNAILDIAMRRNQFIVTLQFRAACVIVAVQAEFGFSAEFVVLSMDPNSAQGLDG
jgi:hypothetical protein